MRTVVRPRLYRAPFTSSAFDLARPLHRADEGLLLELSLSLLGQVGINRGGRTPALIDGPNYQRLASAAIPRREDAFSIGAVVSVRRVNVIALLIIGTQCCKRRQA